MIDFLIILIQIMNLNEFNKGFTCFTCIQDNMFTSRSRQLVRTFENCSIHRKDEVNFRIRKKNIPLCLKFSLDYEASNTLA